MEVFKKGLESLTRLKDEKLEWFSKFRPGISEKIDVGESCAMPMCDDFALLAETVVMLLQGGKFENGFVGHPLSAVANFGGKLAKCAQLVSSLSNLTDAFVESGVAFGDKDREQFDCLLAWLTSFVGTAMGNAEDFLADAYKPQSTALLPVQFEELINFVDETGNINTELEKKIIQMSVPAAMPKYDSLLSVLVALKAFRNPIVQHADDSKIRLVMHSLPVLKLMCQCNVALKDLLSSNGDMDKEVEACKAFSLASREVSSFIGAKAFDPMPVSLGVEKWLAAARLTFVNMMDEAHKETSEIVSRLVPMLIDIKPIMKDLDGKAQELINIPNKAEICQAIKDLNGLKGKGVKRLERLSVALLGNGVDESKAKAWQKDLDLAVDVRHKARLLITVRTGAVILIKKRVQDLKSFFAEAKMMKVTVPAELNRRLLALHST
jgi:hypothetical protein